MREKLVLVGSVLLWLVRYALCLLLALGIGSLPVLLWVWADPKGYRLVPVLIMFAGLYGFGGYWAIRSKRIEAIFDWLSPEQNAPSEWWK